MVVCDRGAYLLELIRYIHLNPVRAKIVKKPEDYERTGHLSYLGKSGDRLIDEGFVLDQLSDNRFLASGNTADLYGKESLLGMRKNTTR